MRFFLLFGLLLDFCLSAQTNFTPIRVNSGGAAFTDASGAAWAADTGFSGGSSWSTAAAVSGTTSRALYQSCRYGEFVYRFAVPNGNYAVNLKFAEISQTHAGDRVFNVDINGGNVLANFDIFAQAGGMNVALDKSIPVSVTGGQIAIQFRNGPANSPLIDAIEIVSRGSAARVNAGGPAVTDSLGQTWSADASFSGGSTWSVARSISNTDTPALYQTCRYGEFAYQFPVSNGNYIVNLKFAEVSQYRAGDRVFNVDIDGVNVLANFDIFAQAGGMNIALDKSFPVSVSGGQITIQFRNGSANSPLVSAIEIVPADSSSAAARVDAGGPAFTDSLGQAWSADSSFSGGLTWSTTHSISNTSSQALYQTCRYGEFSYQFPVSDGNYTVNLKFAEISQSGPRYRVFNVDINGANVLPNFDIFAQAGGMNIALDKSFPISVSGGQITIRFRNGPANSPLVSAIEILPANSGAGSPPVTSGSTTTTASSGGTSSGGTAPSGGSTGATAFVPAGGDLQSAIDNAAPGDTIVLQAGAVYRGTFLLRNKGGSSYVTIQSSALTSLPPDGTRISPANVGSMPRIETPLSTVFLTEVGAHHYRLLGLELAAARGADIDTVVTIGSGYEMQDSDFPHDIEIARCYIHGDPSAGSKRGVSLNGRYLVIRDSYLTDFKRVGQDTQALAGWNGTRYVTISNNVLEGAAENILFTADALLPQYLPQDITIQGNYLHKPLSWKADDPSFNGTHWSIKNILEFKSGLRVLVDGNVFENIWRDAQVGFAVIIESQGPSYGTSQNITFTNNIVRHAAYGIEVCGQACSQVSMSTPVNNVVIRNNFFQDVGTSQWLPGQNGRLFLVFQNSNNVHIQHNTALQDAAILFGDTNPSLGLVFTDNIVMEAWGGVMGSGYAEGNSALGQYYPGYLFKGNLLIGGSSDIYPAGNYFPGTVSSVGFTAPASGDYSIAPSSSYAGRGNDGTNPGVDWNALRTAQAAFNPAQ
jgi:Malectin domain